MLHGPSSDRRSIDDGTVLESDRSVKTVLEYDFEWGECLRGVSIGDVTKSCTTSVESRLNETPACDSHAGAICASAVMPKGRVKNMPRERSKNARRGVQDMEQGFEFGGMGDEPSLQIGGEEKSGIGRRQPRSTGTKRRANKRSGAAKRGTRVRTTRTGRKATKRGRKAKRSVSATSRRRSTRRGRARSRSR
jgi:hypothetical protein